MQLGLFLPTMEGWLGDGWRPRWSELRDLARRAEATGLDAVFVPDHLVFGHSPYWGIREGTARGVWEGWTILAGLAEATRRVALGTYVIGAGFRNPALLAKMAATLEEVSEGRLVLGLGCGSHPPEYAAFGLPYDHRVSRFAEALEIVVPLLREGRVDFAGRYHTARDCEIAPPGPRPGGPPLWIAGYQPRMIGLAARWGDAFTTAWHTGPATLAAPFGALDAACREAGRPPPTVTRTVGAIVSLTGQAPPHAPGALTGPDPETLAAGLLAFRDAGVEHVVCMLYPRDARTLERFAPVVRLVRDAAPRPRAS